MDRNAQSVTKDGAFYEIGKMRVGCFDPVFITSIEYHEPLGDGDRHYVDIHYSNDVIVRHFNIDSVGWKSAEDA